MRLLIGVGAGAGPGCTQAVEASNNQLEIQLRLARSEAEVEIRTFKRENGKETVALRKEVTALRKESVKMKQQSEAKQALISKLQNELEMMRGMLMNRQQLLTKDEPATSAAVALVQVGRSSSNHATPRACLVSEHVNRTGKAGSRARFSNRSLPFRSCAELPCLTSTVLKSVAPRHNLSAQIFEIEREEEAVECGGNLCFESQKNCG